MSEEVYRKSPSVDRNRGGLTWQDVFEGVDADLPGGLPIFSRNRSAEQNCDNYSSIDDINWAIGVQERAIAEIRTGEDLSYDTIDNLDRLVEWCLPPTCDQIVASNPMETSTDLPSNLQKKLRTLLLSSLIENPSLNIITPSSWFGCLSARVALERTTTLSHITRQSLIINKNCEGRFGSTKPLTLQEIFNNRTKQWMKTTENKNKLSTAITGMTTLQVHPVISERELLLMTDKEKQGMGLKLKHNALIQFLSLTENLLKQRHTTPFSRIIEEASSPNSVDVIRAVERDFMFPSAVFPCKHNTLAVYKSFLDRSYRLKNTSAVLRANPAPRVNEMLLHQKQLMTMSELYFFERINFILADDPGTGKMTSILLYLTSIVGDPHVIAIPDDPRVQRNWQELIMKWLPPETRDSISLITPETDSKRLSQILNSIQKKKGSHTAILITFNAILNVVPLMLSFRYRLHTLIIDRRHDSLSGTLIDETILAMLGRLPCVHRIMVVSTAPSLELEECWLACNFLFPKTFSCSAGGMNGWIRDRMIENGYKNPPTVSLDPDEEHSIAQRLLQVACPFIIRHERSELQGMSVVREITLTCDVSEFQKRLYWVICDYATTTINKKEANAIKEAQQERDVNIANQNERIIHEREVYSRQAEGHGQVSGGDPADNTISEPSQKKLIEEKVRKAIEQTVATTAALLAKALLHPVLFYQYCENKEKWNDIETPPESTFNTFIRASGKMATLHCLLREITARTADNMVHKVLLYSSHDHIFDILKEYLTRSTTSDRLSVISQCDSELSRQKELEKYQSDVSTGVSIMLLGVLPIHMNLSVTDTLIRYDIHDDAQQINLVIARCRSVGDPVELRVVLLQSIFPKTTLNEKRDTIETISSSVRASWKEACKSDEGPVASGLTAESLHLKYKLVIIKLLRSHFSNISLRKWNSQGPSTIKQTVDICDSVIDDMQLPNVVDNNTTGKRYINLLSPSEIPKELRTPFDGERVLSNLFPSLLIATIEVLKKDETTTSTDDIFSLITKDGFYGELTTSLSNPVVSTKQDNIEVDRDQHTKNSNDPYQNLLLSPATLSALQKNLQESGYDDAIVKNIPFEPIKSLIRLCNELGIAVTFVEAKLQQTISKWLNENEDEDST